jgi:hypothetical protein
VVDQAAAERLVEGPEELTEEPTNSLASVAAP